jgi:Tol biopolymer transport system component
MIGRRLGPYEITAKLGEGGMGEVWRATDAKLKREVAVKVLPAAFTADNERLARFEREAQMLAQLHHPNIASIFGLEESQGTRALVMELVEGPTLAERLAAGPLPLAEALLVARQIAEALEAAHEKGIVHRDLKPQNIKAALDGRVKVLDFGLAKAMDPVGASGAVADLARSPTLLNSPTLTAAGTQLGVILGTAAYMAPEQARGGAVDKRADIWAFGVVLYEMLTGRSLFAGQTVSDTLAGVLKTEIDWRALSADTPAAIRSLLRRCLERNPKNRLHDIADARIVIEEWLRGEGEPVAAARPASATRPRLALLAWTIAALALALATVLAVRGRREAPPAARPLTAFGVVVPHEHFLNRSQSPLLDLSADGRTLLFVAEGERPPAVFRRSFDRLAVQRIEGTDGAEQPLLSPDGRWIAFFAGGMLRKIPADGGSAVALAEARAPRGASWAPDGSIVYSPLFNSALYRLRSTGGAPAAVTTLENEKGERSHRWPQVLPDGRTVLFTVGLVTSPGDYDGAQIEAVRLDSGERRVVLRGARMARYTAAGYLVYQRGATLLAVRFDPARLETSGEPFAIQDGVGGDTSSGAGYFAVSAAGTVALAPETSIPNERVLVLVDRAGRETELAAPPAPFNTPRFSPDGRRIAFAIGGGAAGDDDVYVFELASARLQRLTFGLGHGLPAWSPDGERVVYTNGRSGETGMISKRADGGGEEVQIHKTAGVNIAEGWLPDGRLVITDAQGTFDIRVLDPSADTVSPLFASPTAAEYGAAIGPGGRYIAYTSTETGTDEIFVETYPPGRGKWQVSAAGGLSPVWSHDGRELYFVAGGSLMAADIETREVFRAGVPRPLFSGPYDLGTPPARNFDVGPDGRFVMVKRRFVSSVPRELVVLDGWSEADPARAARQ